MPFRYPVWMSDLVHFNPLDSTSVPVLQTYCILLQPYCRVPPQKRGRHGHIATVECAVLTLSALGRSVDRAMRLSAANNAPFPSIRIHGGIYMNLSSSGAFFFAHLIDIYGFLGQWFRKQNGPVLKISIRTVPNHVLFVQRLWPQSLPRAVATHTHTNKAINPSGVQTILDNQQIRLCKLMFKL